MSTPESYIAEPILPDQSELEGLASQILDEAKVQGATSAEVAVSIDAGLSVTVRLGEVETLEYHRDRGIGVTVYIGQRKGSASTSDFKSNALRKSVQAACSIAHYTQEDECAGLADKDMLVEQVPDLDLCHPWTVDAEQAIVLATECEDAARQYDERITNSEGATLSSHQGLQVYGNSHGFLGGYASTHHSLSCAVVGEVEGRMQRDYWYTVARAHTELETPVIVGRHAADRTVRRLGGRKLTTCQVPVLFSPEVARGLFGHFVSAVKGASLYRKATFLLDHLGKSIFPDFIHIHEQPHLKGSLGGAPFDSEGVQTKVRDLVKDGVLCGYVLSSYSARKLGMQTTGNAGGVHNLIIDSGDKDLTGLLREMNRGVLITELMGHGVTLVTGDYSRGAAGFWVENGEIQYPVDEITIAGNLRDMFSGIVAVGTDVDIRGNIRTGSVLIEQMTVAGE
ncbi:MAG: metalloprotease PmbA [Gammaproteobacteria bacterium]